MEEESFEDLAIANLLNKHFINIKVDREQLPDIDNTYMMAAAMLSGHTGWPLNAFLTPEGAPFYAATYFPPEQFKDLTEEIANLWQHKPSELISSGQTVLDAINQLTSSQEGRALPENISFQTVENWLGIADEMQGGFGIAPKFPNEPTLLFLLQHSVKNQDNALFSHLEHTLQAMQQGGIFDQVRGGFHRYTIDPEWLIPHFEKMLYNQAQLTQVYLQAFEITGNPLYRRTAELTLQYVLDEMTSPDALFYSATDADSEGEEGKYFLWDKSELKALLTDKEFNLINEFYGLNQGTNFDGKNILYLPQSLPEFVISKGIPVQEFLHTLTLINQKLLQARNQRISPHRDDKAITSWNSLMIRTLVNAYSILKNERYLLAAIDSANSLWEKHVRSTGLLRDSRGEAEGKSATLEDYSFFTMANIVLFDITGNRQWLERATLLTDEMIALFWDEESSSFYISREDTLLPIRAKDRGDNAIPGGLSVSYELLSNLAARQADQRYAILADRLLASTSSKIAGRPMQYSHFLDAIDSPLSGGEKIQFAAQGAVRAELLRTDDHFQLDVTLKPGWHINAHSPGNKKLVGSRLSADWIKSITYPSSIKKQLGFTPNPIYLYTDNIRFTIKATDNKQTLDQLLNFTFQACSDRQCLAPETLYFSSAIQ